MRIKRILALSTVAAVGFAMTCAPGFATEKNLKDESVYVITDSTGSVTETIVSDHIINNEKDKELVDETDLSDIDNLKGDEKFTKGAGDEIVWAAEGNDITYQGTSDKEMPVKFDVTYYLDETKVDASKLEGASGNVKIKIAYHNDTNINGSKVPFIVMSGFIANNDEMTNIKITSGNGKVIDDGDKSIVVVMAAPGVADALDVDASEIGFEDTVVITGKATNFQTKDIMTVVTNSFFEDIDGGIAGDFNYDSKINLLNSSSKQLKEGSQELYDGIHMLYEKSDELGDGVDKLDNGASSIKKGAKKLKNGSARLAEGIKSLKEATEKLEAGATAVAGGVVQVQNGINGDNGLAKGSKNLADGASQVSTGASELADNMTKLEGGINQLKALDQGAAGVSQAISGAKQAAGGADKAVAEFMQMEGFNDLTDEQKAKVTEIITMVKTTEGALDKAEEVNSMVKSGTSQIDTIADGASDLADGADTLAIGAKGVADGASQIADGIATVQSGINGKEGLAAGSKAVADGLAKVNGKDGAETLVSGADELSKGAKKLNSGAKTLASGMSTLNKNTGTLIEGVGQLDAGSKQLKNGMDKFYREGIKKIVDLYNENIKGLSNNIDSLIDAGKAYKSFTQISNDMDGSVKFIYKTEIISE